MKKYKKLLLLELLLICILLGVEKTFVIAFISIMIHEGTHILVARYKGVKFSNLQFHIYGSSVELKELRDVSDNDKLLIYSSGAIINIIISLIFIIINIKFPQKIFLDIISCNIGLACFNLLPAYPLDGAKIFEVILNKKKTYKQSLNIIVILSYIISFIFLIGFVLLAIFYNEYNFSIIIASIIIIYISHNERKNNIYLILSSLILKKDKLIKNKYIENKIISIYHKEKIVSLIKHLNNNKFNIFYVVDEDYNFKYKIYESELVEILVENGNLTLEEYGEKLNFRQ